uniref:Uncharacterized protein n=1 Tax=Rangifer tarandus platyrhynchus TaxID=3082113 RepID=A0ACB0DWR2_RANTA|nr:unnamed protein product [Rangifer tarandus platyrhynchus]
MEAEGPPALTLQAGGDVRPLMVPEQTAGRVTAGPASLCLGAAQACRRLVAAAVSRPERRPSQAQGPRTQPAAVCDREIEDALGTRGHREGRQSAECLEQLPRPLSEASEQHQAESSLDEGGVSMLGRTEQHVQCAQATEEADLDCRERLCSQGSQDQFHWGRLQCLSPHCPTPGLASLRSPGVQLWMLVLSGLPGFLPSEKQKSSGICRLTCGTGSCVLLLSCLSAVRLMSPGVLVLLSSCQPCPLALLARLSIVLSWIQRGIQNDPRLPTRPAVLKVAEPLLRRTLLKTLPPEFSALLPGIRTWALTVVSRLLTPPGSAHLGDSWRDAHRAGEDFRSSCDLTADAVQGDSASSLAFRVSTWDPGAGRPGDVVTATAPATAPLTAGTEQGRGCGHACDRDRCQTMTAVLSVRASAWVDAPGQDCPGARSENQQDRALQLPFLSLALALGSQTYRDPVHARAWHPLPKRPSPRAGHWLRRDSALDSRQGATHSLTRPGVVSGGRGTAHHSTHSGLLAAASAHRPQEEKLLSSSGLRSLCAPRAASKEEGGSGEVGARGQATRSSTGPQRLACEKECDEHGHQHHPGRGGPSSASLNIVTPSEMPTLLSFLGDILQGASVSRDCGALTRKPSPGETGSHPQEAPGAEGDEAPPCRRGLRAPFRADKQLARPL